jgi:hypothetical protein
MKPVERAKACRDWFTDGARGSVLWSRASSEDEGRMPNGGVASKIELTKRTRNDPGANRPAVSK